MTRLEHLAELGVTAIGMISIAAFAGTRDWGYHGALLYAPQCTYGRAEDLKALIDSAHAYDIMVMLDVVYNHFGPEGNYLTAYAPQSLLDSVASSLAITSNSMRDAIVKDRGHVKAHCRATQVAACSPR
jgi:1,4-alpha-glucan branching enzyme